MPAQKKTKRKPPPPSQKPPEEWNGPARVTSTGRVMPISPGRPRKVLDAKIAERLARSGHTVGEAADILGVSRETFHLRLNDDPEFSAAWARGKAQRARWLRGKQDALVNDGSVAMAIFLGKNELGQSDSPKIDVSITHEMRFVAEWSDGSVIRKELPAAGEDVEVLEAEPVDDAEWSDEEAS